jgi:hypothetical protein
MDKELHILQHSLGVDEYGRGEQYRNHFATGEGTTDWPACNELVQKGLMDVRRNHQLSAGMDCFWVTDAGKAYVAEHSPKPPKISRAKERYKRYLEYGDGFDNFRHFLTWDSEPERSWNSKNAGGDRG